MPRDDPVLETSLLVALSREVAGLSRPESPACRTGGWVMECRCVELRSLDTEWLGSPCDTRRVVERYFNTEGPVVEEDHYCLPPLS